MIISLMEEKVKLSTDGQMDLLLKINLQLFKFASYSPKILKAYVTIKISVTTDMLYLDFKDIFNISGKYCGYFDTKYRWMKIHKNIRKNSKNDIYIYIYICICIYIYIRYMIN